MDCSQQTEDEIEFPGLKTILDVVKKPFKELMCGTGSTSPPVWDESNEYDFNHQTRGTMVIFNNEFFKAHSSRPGSSIDAMNLMKTFSDLGFTVRCYDNQTRDQMLSILKKVAKEDHSKADCFACAILSHGDEVHIVDKAKPGIREREDLVYATDQIILTSEIVRLFIDAKCQSLRGKPRMFFIQACRGSKLDGGVNVGVTGEDEVDAKPVRPVEVYPCPIYKDFMIMYATPPGYYAFRRPDSGSWFITGLCEVLSQPEVNGISLTRLLTLVQKYVSQEFQSRSSKLSISGKKQTPCLMSMLVKDIYFRKRGTLPSSSNDVESPV